MAKSGVLGYPRIGAKREWKKALEAFWAGKLDEAELDRQLQDIRLQHLLKMKEKGIDFIPVGDFSDYDHVLDTATMFGIVPKRFSSYNGGIVPKSIYYGIARGMKNAAASEMTKWFNTNYHFIVPELDGVTPALTENKPLLAYREAKQLLGIEGRPVLLGPLTLLKLSKGSSELGIETWLDRLIPLYVQVLQALEREGVAWVQIDEPILVTECKDADVRCLQTIYEAFTASAPGLKFMLQTYFESVEAYRDIIELPVHGIGLDFVHGLEGNLSAIKALGFPSDKMLGAGVINGRGIWKASLSDNQTLLDELARYVPAEQLIVQTSCSLLHVPVSVQGETRLAPELRDALAFADEKLDELVLLTRAVSAGGDELATKLQRYDLAAQALRQSEVRNKQDIQQAAATLAIHEPKRGKPFAERTVSQREKWKLPVFPTTTIGSFPQSAEVRKARQLWRRGEWNGAQYVEFIRQQIERWIRLQEEIGLDVLVHGEFERTDMVEFFGEKLGGFAFTQHGWVQSYGSRCVKPPIIYGDVVFQGAMTVEETKYAQSLTSRPVKGMLTGPITIMNWSFVREDIPREQIAYQLAYALRQEVQALEEAGIGMIQVDEPAIREGLPLKEAKQDAYLNWAVRAFRMSVCAVKDETQIHTHMCYSEFHDMIDAIDAMDADVISIETSRSHGELIGSFESNTYSKGIGLGVYDIHSPRVPTVEEMTNLIDRALQVLDPNLFWINPDCGLKTRGDEETIAALQNMVKAALLTREKYQVTVK
ncbi:5-methyltetrahydropteroyltriglutamate--homocysteine S-methyltransferase [Alicyclobacillus fodiniaquatilis]|uniref:5-methyltetrahydropteroyltriglutamate--homocysteine methyltransferase n=1 Tax=Alicyclobacillus fodiniaquatilis TaxID=1661150 RepID=A0ABW4JLR4_9BACL